MSCSNKEIGVTIFGTGRIGTIHFKNLFLHPQVNIRWIVEEDVDRAHSLVSKYRQQDKIKVIKTEDADQALNDPKYSNILHIYFHEIDIYNRKCFNMIVLNINDHIRIDIKHRFSK